jgi:hypothetical protein
MLYLAPVLSLLIAQTSAAQAGTASWPAEFSAGGSVGHFSQGSFYRGWQGSAGGSATWFVRRPVVDDGTPFSLQSFLQRLDALSLGFGGSGFSAKDDLTLYQHRGQSVNATLGGYFYLGDFVLGGGLYYETVNDTQVAAGQTSEEKHTTQLGSPDVTAGWRHDTFEMVGEYHLRSYYDDGVARPLRWGQASLRLRSVLEDQFYLRLEGYTVVGGGGASCDFESFSSQDLGVWLSGFYERGQIYVNSSTDYHRQGASVGVGWWSTHRFELQFSLGISTVKRADDLGSALTTAVATMTVVLRAPDRYQPARPAVAPLAEPLPTTAQAPPQTVPAEIAPPVEVKPPGDVTGPAQPAPPAENPAPPPAPPADSSPRETDPAI